MLNAVLKEINNYFFKYTSGVKNYQFTKDVAFTADTLTATSFADTYIAGEYILIEGTRINDGVYLITAIGATTITVDSTLDITISIEPEVETILTKCYIPGSLLALIADIKTYDTKVTTGLASESQGNRSISYAGSSGWRNAFNSQLSVYKKLRWC